MKSIIYLVLIVVAAFCTGFKAGQPNNLQLLESYRMYYTASEALLDTLNSEYNWVDAFDPEDYYEAVSNLQTVLQQ